MFFRIFFVLTLLILAVLAEDVKETLLLCVISSVTLVFRGAKLYLFVKTLSLLLWLFVPIILFHGLFSPGVFIQEPFFLPLSVEGLERALQLCLHITAIFFAALLLTRILKLTEYYYCLSLFPKQKARLMPYLLLLPTLRAFTQNTLAEQRLIWRKQGHKWLSLPYMLVQMMELVIAHAKNEAQAIWLNWDERIKVIAAPLQVKQKITFVDTFYGLLALFIWGTLWIS